MNYEMDIVIMVLMNYFITHHDAVCFTFVSNVTVIEVIDGLA